MIQPNKILHSLNQRLNLFDKALLLIFFVGLGIFVVFFRRIPTWTEATFKITEPHPLAMSTPVTNEYALNIHQGDIERNELGEIVAEVIDKQVYQTDPYTEVIYLTIKLKTLYNPRKQMYTAKGRPLIFGQPFTFDFTNTRFQALVVDFPGKQLQPQSGQAIVQAQIRADDRSFSDISGVPEYLADQFNVGDQVLDNQGHPVVTILEVESRPARRTIQTTTNEMRVINDPQLKDVYLKLELSTLVIDDRHYMPHYVPVQVSQTVPLNLETVSVWPTITNILEMNDSQ